jgi:hypothetical protein
VREAWPAHIEDLECCYERLTLELISSSFGEAADFAFHGVRWCAAGMAYLSTNMSRSDTMRYVEGRERKGGCRRLDATVV